VAVLRRHGWYPVEAPPADDCPDGVFIEDTVVVCDRLAIVTRPGAPQRRPETSGVEATLRSLRLDIARSDLAGVDIGKLDFERIEAPGTLDGGDVLQVGDTVYVGRGGRTNADGVRQLRNILTGIGRRVVAVPLGPVLHLKSATTTLPDGTFLAWGGLVDTALFPGVREVPEEAGAHVVLLGGDDVLISASAPRTADMVADLGYSPVVVDIGEFERLEGCVTCLSVLLPV
jgi:dimethylargininase